MRRWRHRKGAARVALLDRAGHPRSLQHDGRRPRLRSVAHLRGRGSTLRDDGARGLRSLLSTADDRSRCAVPRRQEDRHDRRGRNGRDGRARRRPRPGEVPGRRRRGQQPRAPTTRRPSACARLRARSLRRCGRHVTAADGVPVRRGRVRLWLAVPQRRPRQRRALHQRSVGAHLARGGDRVRPPQARHRSARRLRRPPHRARRLECRAAVAAHLPSRRRGGPRRPADGRGHLQRDRQRSGRRPRDRRGRVRRSGGTQPLRSLHATGRRRPGQHVSYHPPILPSPALGLSHADVPRDGVLAHARHRSRADL
jgi:hypothetical protein